MSKVGRSEPEAVATYGELGDDLPRLPKLEMENALLDLLGTSLIPVLSTDVAAGTSGNVHL